MASCFPRGSQLYGEHSLPQDLVALHFVFFVKLAMVGVKTLLGFVWGFVFLWFLFEVHTVFSVVLSVCVFEGF